MTARHRRVPILLLLFASASFVAFAGCAKQGEGDRCVYAANGNKDCDTGLVCVQAAQLQQQGADRCCPPEGQPIHVSSCTRSGSIGTGGAGGTEAGIDSGNDASSDADGQAGSAGAGGTGGSGGTSSGGMGGVSGAGGASDASAG